MSIYSYFMNEYRILPPSLIYSVLGLPLDCVTGIIEVSPSYEQDLEAVLDLVTTCGLSFYLRCPSAFNMARGDDVPRRLIMQQLRYAQLMGCKGLIVPSGRHSILNKDKAMEYMKREMNLLYQEADSFCPILLESTEKIDTELFADVNQLVAFANDYDDRVGICLHRKHLPAEITHLPSKVKVIIYDKATPMPLFNDPGVVMIKET